MMSDSSFSLKFEGEKGIPAEGKWKVEFQGLSGLYDTIWLKGIFSKIGTDDSSEKISIY